MKHLLLLAALAPLASAANLAAQAPASTDASRATQAVDVPPQLTPEILAEIDAQLLLDEPGDGRTWARGDRWKASFGPEGLTYIPFFGSDAPRNYPLRLDLVQATVAGQALPLAPRERSRVGHRVALDRGALAEVYHLTPSTVEQTFVFDHLPERGALHLEIEVETELQPVLAPGGGIDFHHELGRVHYSGAIAIDARGRTLELTQALTSKGLRITVPAAFVRTATLPLVVDPILSTISVVHDARRQVAVDVAYEGNNATYQIVYSELQSGLDSDIIAISYNASLGLLISPAAIDITSTYWGDPSNASCYHEEQFLCGAVVGVLIGNRTVWGRTRHAGTGNLGPQFQISGFGAETVDVGGKGNSVASAYDYMVVWQEADTLNQDFDIVAQAVEGDSTLTGGRIVIDGDVGDMDRKPAISKSSGRPGTSNADNEYMIVWEREISPTDHNIRAQVIEYTGILTGHSQFNAYSFSDALDPDVSSVNDYRTYNDDPYWVIAFERRIGSLYSIFTVVARDGNADNARNVNVMQNLDLDLDHRDPVIAQDSQDYLIAYQSEAPNGDRLVHLAGANVVHDGGELRTGLALRRETLDLSSQMPASMGLATHWDGGGPFGAAEPGDAIMAWIVRDATTQDYEVAGAIVAEVTSSVSGSQFCEAAVNSTGTSAWVSARTVLWTPGSTVSLTASDMPANVFGHFIVSDQPGFVLNPGGSQGHLCLQGAIGRYNAISEILWSGTEGSATLNIDSSTVPSPFGPTTVLSGQTWNFQCWFRDNGPNSNFTNAVGITFD